MKKHLRAVLVGALVGLLSIGAALAGTLIGPLDPPDEPVSLPSSEEVLATTSISQAAVAGDIEVSPEEVAAVLDATVKAPDGEKIPDEGVFLVGASRVSLHPAPTLFGGETWMTEECSRLGVAEFDPNFDHALPPVDPSDPVNTVDEIRSWPASSPDCIYLGGFGLGPVRPARGVSEGGVWIRSVAISNGEKTFIYQIADLVGWFARYDQTICDDCGILDVRLAAAEDLGIDAGNVIVASTHSHATADTYGGWGGIPDWYRNQIRDSAVAGAKQAVSQPHPGDDRRGGGQLAPT